MKTLREAFEYQYHGESYDDRSAFWLWFEEDKNGKKTLSKNAFDKSLEDEVKLKEILENKRIHLLSHQDRWEYNELYRKILLEAHMNTKVPLK